MAQLWAIVISMVLLIRNRSEAWFQLGTGGSAHQDYNNVVPRDQSEAIDHQGNQLGDRHHLVVHHLVPLLVLHLNREGHKRHKEHKQSKQKQCFSSYRKASSQV